MKLRRFRHLIRWAMRTSAKRVKQDIPSYVASIANELPREAATILRTPAQQALFEENFRLGFAQNEEGVYEMTLALWGWGFEPREIRQPVDIFYGTEDGIISPRMSLDLAQKLPAATAREWNGANHYSFVDRDCWIDFLTAAREPADA